jgi:hypothetical protein
VQFIFCKKLSLWSSQTSSSLLLRSELLMYTHAHFVVFCNLSYLFLMHDYSCMFWFVFVTLVCFETSRLLFSLRSSLSPVSCSRFTICVQFPSDDPVFCFSVQFVFCKNLSLWSSQTSTLSLLRRSETFDVHNCALCCILQFLLSLSCAWFFSSSILQRMQVFSLWNEENLAKSRGLGMRSTWSFFVALLFVPTSTLPSVWSLYCGVVQDHVVCFYNNHYSHDCNLGVCLHLCVGASFLAGSTRAVVPLTLKSCESRVASSHIWWDLLSEFVLCLSVAILSCFSRFSCSITALLCVEIWTKRRSEYEPGGAKTLYKLIDWCKSWDQIDAEKGA